MPTITRADNTEFIAQPYREQLSLKNFTILKREVRHLAQFNGQFVRLFKLSNGIYETVFSHDPGFLLGESVWHYFGKPENLVYCEELNSEQVLLVLIRSGEVFLDGKFLKTSIKEELSLLANSTAAFIIKTYGNVPLALERSGDALNPEKFYFTEQQTASITVLSESVFDKLSARADLQLLSLEQALLEHRVKIPFVSSLLVMALIVIGGVWFYKQHMTPPPVAPQQTDPYLNFRQALETPAPQKELAALSNNIIQTYDMPGWVATQVNSNGSNAVVQLHSLGGTLAQLFQWAQLENTEVDLSTSGASLQMNANVSQRPEPTIITNTEQVTAHVIDSMLAFLPGRSVAITNFTSFGVYKKAELSINVNAISPSVLSLIGLQFKGLPISLENVSLQVNQGLLTGTIKIAILGN